MKPRRPRVHARSWYSGTLDHDELHVRRARIKFNRGAVRQKIDPETGEVTSTMREPGAVCGANIGDRIMLFGPKLDEIATAEIVTIYPSGDKAYIAFRCGELEKTTRDVKILRLVIEKTTTKVKLIAGVKK